MILCPSVFFALSKFNASTCVCVVYVCLDRLYNKPFGAHHFYSFIHFVLVYVSLVFYVAIIVVAVVYFFFFCFRKCFVVFGRRLARRTELLAHYRYDV